MKKTQLIILIVLLVLSISLFADVRIKESKIQNQYASQINTRATLLNVDLADGVFPPAGWTIDAQASHWSASATANAGGSAPEMHFNYNPQFVGTSRLISPVINTTGYTSINLEFKHMVDWYANPFTIGVATRSSNGTWNNVWTTDPHANITELRSIVINNTDVGSDTFQFCIFFTGDSYNIDDWFIDNVLLYSPEAHDFKPVSITANWQYAAGQPMTPVAVVKNNGLNDDTGNVVCKIFQFDQEVYNQTVSATITSGQEQNVTFPAFTPSVDNEVYNILVYSDLAGDLDHTNDSLSTEFNTYNVPKANVLLEIGTGTWCGYCPGAAMGADDLIENGQNVAVLENHNGDPYANDYSNARNDYYGISGFPTAIFDGLSSVVGGNHTQSMYSTYLPIYNELSQVKTGIDMGMRGLVEGTDVTVAVDMTRLGRLTQPNLALFVVLTQSEIAQSWQGQTELNYVVRSMAPDEEGTPVDLTAVDNLTITNQMTFTASWPTEDLEIVAFIQDPASKIVYQTIKCPLNELPALANDNVVVNKPQMKLIGNYPNPFNPTTSIRFSMEKAGHVTLDVYNVKGQKVNTLVNGYRNNGIHNIIWNGKDANGNNVGSGVYYYQLKSGNMTETKKMIMIK